MNFIQIFMRSAMPLLARVWLCDINVAAVVLTTTCHCRFYHSMVIVAAAT